MRGSPDFRIKNWQDLLGEKECEKLIAMAWADIPPSGLRAWKKWVADQAPLRVKHIDRSVLVAIVHSGRTSAQSTAHRDMTGYNVGWYRHKKSP